MNEPAVDVIGSDRCCFKEAGKLKTPVLHTGSSTEDLNNQHILKLETQD